MAVRTRDEIINMVKNRIGEDVSDEALSLLEDVTDTLSDYDSRLSESGDWKSKYEENDANWRQRYRERFENVPSVAMPEDTVEFVPAEVETVVEEGEEKQTYDDLFSRDN